MIRSQALVWVLLAALLPAVAQARTPTHVVCVGDSITVGVGATVPEKAYPAVLQNELGSAVVVKNFGVAGSTMLSNSDYPYENQGYYEQAKEFVMDAPAGAVVDVVIMLGTNDSKPYNWTPTGKPKQDVQYVADYKLMIQTFAAMPAKPAIYVMLPPATGAMPCCDINGTVIADEILPLIKQIGMDYQLPVIDAHTPFDGHPELLNYDAVHPNDDGNATLAQIVFDGLAAPYSDEAIGGAGSIPNAGASEGGSPSTETAGTAGTAGLGTAGTLSASAGASESAADGKQSSGCSYASPRAPAHAAWLALGIVALASMRRRRKQSC